jgi:hypothetical protein
MKDKVIKIYNRVIIVSAIVVILSIMQSVFNIINVQQGISIAVGFYAFIGLVSFIAEKADYKNKYNK